MQNSSYREDKKITQGGKANKWQNLDSHPGQTDDYNSKAIMLWILRCQVTELFLYPVGNREPL